MSAPKHTPIQTAVINSSIDAKLFHTYAHLVMLAWRHDFKFTDWLRQADLERIIGLDWSNIKRHTAELQRAGLIDWTTNGKSGRRFFIVEVRLEDGAKAQYCAPSSGSGINSVNDDELLLLLPDKAQNCALDLILDKEAWEALRIVGVGEPARTELSNLPNVTAGVVQAHTAGVARDFNHGLINSIVPVLIYRLRNDWPVPELCEQCGGLDGEHADGCPTQAGRRETMVQDSRRIEPPQPDENARIWSAALEQLRMQLTDATVDTWLKRTSLVGEQNGAFVITVHNEFAKEWLESRLIEIVKRTLAGIIGRDVEVRFVVAETAQAL